MTNLSNLFHSMNAWAHDLPAWGLACVLLLLTGVSKKMGLLVSIGCSIAIWGLFGMLWGLFCIGALMCPWVILMIIVLFLAILGK